MELVKDSIVYLNHAIVISMSNSNLRLKNRTNLLFEDNNLTNKNRTDSIATDW